MGAMLTKNNVRLTLEGARAVLAAAEKEAITIKAPMNISVVDEGGHLLTFARMDGAKLSSVAVAMTKSVSASLRRTPSGPTPSATDPNIILTLGLSFATNGNLTGIRGGLPLFVGDQCVGAIGASGGTEDEDVQVAQAGVDALAGLG